MQFGNITRIADVADCALLCVPGGFGTVEAMGDPIYLDNLRRLAASARYITSVCTGSLLLGAAGLLVGRRAACHWAWRDGLAHELLGEAPYIEAGSVREGFIAVPSRTGVPKVVTRKPPLESMLAEFDAVRHAGEVGAGPPVGHEFDAPASSGRKSRA